MKLILKTILSLALTLFSLNLFAADYYLLFEENCMERREYSYDQTVAGNEFVVYAYPLNTAEKLLMEVGLEANKPVRQLNPQEILRCGDSRLNMELRQAVNAKVHRLFMVVPTDQPGQYRIAQVNNLGYFKSTASEIVVESLQYSFRYNRAGGRNQGDLAIGSTRGSIKFVDKAEIGSCQAMLFYQTFSYSNNNYLSIFVVPEFGVVSEQASNGDSSFRVRQVNNQNSETYLNTLCQTGNTYVTTQQSSTPESYSVGRSGMVSKGVVSSGSVVSRTVATIHTVKKGETLYGIAQQYGLKVDELKSWNNLSSNTIRQNMKLIVSPPPIAQTERIQPVQPQSYATELNRGTQTQTTVETFTARSPMPQTGDAPVMRPAWETTTGVHTVQADETVGSIARLYGYTEARFRHFNGLAPDEVVNPGQRLHSVDPATSAKGEQPKSYSTQRDPNVDYSGMRHDPYNDFEGYSPYPQEFQPRQEVAQPQPDAYGQGLRAKGVTPPNTNVQPYQNGYYGPVPGQYNNNQPLNEPSSYQYRGATEQPDAYNTGRKGVNTFQERSPVPSATSNQYRTNTNTNPAAKASPPYGSVQQPDAYNTNRFTARSPYAAPATLQRTEYTVQDGESINSIARRFGLTPDRLRYVNSLEKNEIVIPGQKIYLN